MESLIHLSKHVLVLFVLCSGKTRCTGGSEASHLSTDSRHSEDTGQNYFFYQQSEYPRDCQEVRRGCSALNRSGVYVIKPDGYLDPFEVYCDHDEGSGGWMVIQRRVDGLVNFARTWEDYKNGFGFLSNNFWLGNEKLSYMTNQAVYELRMDMELSNGSSFYVSYSGFRISDELDHYKILQIEGFSSSGAIVVNTEPTFQTGCPATLAIKAYGTRSAVATFSPPLCDDAEEIGVVTSVCSSTGGLTSGSSFPIGTTTVTCTCTDSGFLTASCSFLVEVSESTCESGWLTYGGSQYCVYQHAATWFEANSECSSIGSHLVWVESEAENQFLRDNVAAPCFWLGLRDVTEGVWRYEGSSVVPTYFKWHSNEPNNSGGDEDCVHMYSDGYWNDLSCTFRDASASICDEYPITLVCESA